MNALKNSDFDVLVEFGANKGRAHLTVQDKGGGFPNGFDPAKDANTGLELVQQMSAWDLQGSVEFANSVEGGGCVTVQIPLGATPNYHPAPA
jgi:two-component sensor histidine kinase